MVVRSAYFDKSLRRRNRIKELPPVVEPNHLIAFAVNNQGRNIDLRQVFGCRI